MEWINVNERLPEDDKEVLIYIKHADYPCQALYTDGYWVVSRQVRDTAKDGDMSQPSIPLWATKDITHWMPLPEPPKQL